MSFCLTDALDFLEELLSIPSVEGERTPAYPFGKPCADALNLCLTKLEELGYETTNLDNYCGYATIGDGELFDILAHLDVVPAGDGWSTEPFSPTFKHGKLYARGALDNKGPIVATMFAIARLQKEGHVFRRKLRLILGCDEESGWECMEYFKSKEQFAEEGFSPDGDFPVINCEKGIVHYVLTTPIPKGIKNIQGGERVNMVPSHAKVTFDDGTTLEEYGTSAHGSHPEKGDNAIAKLVNRLPSDYLPLKSLVAQLADYRGTSLSLNLFDEKSGSLTLNLGTISTINQNIVIELDVRYPVSYTMEAVTAILTDRLDCTVEQGFYHLPLYLPPTDVLVTTLLDAYNKVTGECAKPISIGGGTYARCLKRGVAFGPVFSSDDANIHEKDECISLESFLKMSDVYYEAIKAITT